MSNEQQDMRFKPHRTRRNIMKMGAILGSAAVASLASPRRGLAHHHDNDNDNDRHHAPPATPYPHHHCLLRGTTVTSVDGDRKIEDLAIGDRLPTKFGGTRPIQWIARYSLKKSDPSKPWARAALPVRIARSALAPNVPKNDLYLSSGHSLLIDGLLIQVGNLINGTTIKNHETVERDELEYFQIKLESHDVIYAEGAPVETMLRVDESAANFVEYFRIYGDLKSEEIRCAPFATYGGGRGEFKSRVRSAISPWIDVRQQLDVIRDRLEERGLALSRQLEVAS